jgi:hypothetical protein
MCTTPPPQHSKSSTDFKEGGVVNEWAFRLDLAGLDIDDDAYLDAL